MKRLSAIFLLLTLLFTACAQATNNDNDTPADTTTSDLAQSEETTVTNASAVRELHGDKNYGGKEFRIYSISPGKHFYSKARDIENEIYFEEETGEVLYDAIYRRNVMTEELLNVKIVPVWGGDTGDLQTKGKQSIMAGDDIFDVYFNRLDYILNLSQEKLMVNLYDVDTLDKNAPWWSESIVNNFTMFNDMLYTIAGDANFYDDYAVAALFFNQRIMNEMAEEYPYQKVRDGEWVLDELIRLCAAATKDLNGDGEMKDADDQWGLCDHNSVLLHFVYSCGEPLAYVDDDGALQINYSERQINVVEKLYNFLKESQTVKTSGDYLGIFKSGRILFFYEMIGGITAQRDMEDDFGVLPIPKYDKNQTDYQAYVSNGWTTAFSIPMTNDDLDFTGVVLDTLCAFSTDTVASAVLDIMLAEKMVRDQESQEMLTYVFNSKTYDWAGDLQWASNLRGIYDSLMTSSSNTFVSQFESKIAAIEASRDALVESYKSE